MMESKFLKIKSDETTIRFENGNMIQILGVKTDVIRSLRGEKQLEEIKKYTMSTSKENIICPYCGWVEKDSWEYDINDIEYECPNCENISTLWVEISVEYTTRKIKDDKYEG